MLKITHEVTVKDNRVFKNPSEIKGHETFYLIPTESELIATINKYGGNIATVKVQYEII